MTKDKVPLGQDVKLDYIHHMIFWTCPICRHRNSTQHWHGDNPVRCEDCPNFVEWKPSESKLYIG